MKTAADLKLGERAIIKEIDTTHPSSHRIIEFGFTPGQSIELINKSIFSDPIALSVRGSLVAIRKKEANCIKI
jgi:ferrous iron transport protein A